VLVLGCSSETSIFAFATGTLALDLYAVNVRAATMAVMRVFPLLRKLHNHLGTS
jgi:hypothetical protein